MGDRRRSRRPAAELAVAELCSQRPTAVPQAINFDQQLALFPGLVAHLLLRRSLVSGIAAGATKG
ncbi:hypothetical protein [Streptomyces sp. NPDC060002]|uniref:hypothetical protein n=1 Tax=Streptomyces sp. NPDC060002 TaxID=3347033 RepID=UPI0036BE948A